MRAFLRRTSGRRSVARPEMVKGLASGQRGERQEHLDDILKNARWCYIRKVFRVLDRLTAGHAAGSLPTACQWLLDTRAAILKKSKEEQSGGRRQMEDEDADWLGWMGGIKQEDIMSEAEVHRFCEVIMNQVRKRKEKGTLDGETKQP